MEINKVLIDTNVCLDAAIQREPFAGAAIEILFRSEQGIFPGFVAAHSFDTIFYFLAKRSNKSNAYNALKGLRKAVQVAPITQQIIDRALELAWDDFEDAIHYESARRAKCQAIITRNEKDFRNADLLVLSPGEFMERLK